jgi:drug/metabolite transporter (DMT)-like permease
VELPRTRTCNVRGDLPPSEARLGYVCVAGAAALWGLWSLALRSAERYQVLSPASESFILFVVMFVSVAPFAWQARSAVPRPWAAWALIAVLGLSDALNSLFFFWSMQRTTLSVAVLTHYLAPIFVALLAPSLLGEHMGKRTWGALGLASSGLILLLEPWRTAGGALGSGALFGAASAVFYAGNTLLAKRLSRWFGSSEILAWHLPPALAVLGLCLPEHGLAIKPVPLVILVIGSLLMGALAGVLYLNGLKRVQASHASVLTLIEPLVAVAVGVIVWKETPTLFGVAGGLLVLSGAARVLGETVGTKSGAVG